MFNSSELLKLAAGINLKPHGAVGSVPKLPNLYMPTDRPTPLKPEELQYRPDPLGNLRTSTQFLTPKGVERFLTANNPNPMERYEPNTLDEIDTEFENWENSPVSPRMFYGSNEQKNNRSIDAIQKAENAARANSEYKSRVFDQIKQQEGEASEYAAKMRSMGSGKGNAEIDASIAPAQLSKWDQVKGFAGKHPYAMGGAAAGGLGLLGLYLLLRNRKKKAKGAIQ